MSLSIEQAVRGIAAVIHDRVAPTLTDGYATEAVRLSVIMLGIMANAADDAVALRVAEHVELRALLGTGAQRVIDPALRDDLARAAVSTDPGLRISQLDQESDRLRRLLIALQVDLEGQDTDVARAFAQEIWRFLLAVETARAPRV